jgi:galactokinase
MMNEILIKNTTDFFQKTFNSDADKIVLSPGRINIIGEHIDYNDGYVLPAAIDKIICFAFEKNTTNSANIQAIDLNESVVIDVTKEAVLSDSVWTNYLRGVLFQLRLKGYEIGGFNCAFSSNIPTGSGLSSSAALECGFLFGINELFHLKIKPIDMALMGQSAEHWVGINCGIMDQFSSVMGLENKVIKIDCRTLDYTYHTANFIDYSLVLLDSNVKHSLFTSEYNNRRIECNEGLSIVNENYPEIESFRDCDVDHIINLKSKMSENVFKRSLYAVKEIKRVIQACEALDNGDIKTLGKLMFETHDGLSKDYEVSCDELDYLVDLAKTEEDIIGSRLMGGGFGGCAITLIKKGKEAIIKEKFTKLYLEKFNIDLKIYDIKVSNGTSLHKN